MRLKSVTAADRAQALARVRACLGEDAVIVATQELKGGGVRVTAALDDDEVDLGALLAPPARPETAWFAGLAAHHEIPDGLRDRLREALDEPGDAEPAAALAQALRARFRFAPLAQADALLLSGPPGAGKTASIAKLAARAVLAGRTVRVVTADVQRAGGVEQLASLLAPLRLQPLPAPDLGTLRQAVGAAGADLLLIDSPGFNPFRPADLGRVSALVEASGAKPVLVLAAGLAPRDCAEIAATYQALGTERMLVTKVDAARRLGGMLAAADAGLAFAEAGIGPTIGQGLSPLSPMGLARLLLHAHSRSAGAAAPAAAAAAAGGARRE